MNNFLLKTQINDNPPQVWNLIEPFNISSDAEVTKNLNYLMLSHFSGFEPAFLRIDCIHPRFLYFIGKQVLLNGDLVNKCFTRKSAKADIANNQPPEWQGTSEEFKNLVLATPEDKFNDFLAPDRLSVPAFDKPTGYRDILKILRTTAEETPFDPDVQYIDAFDFLKVHLENHVSELDDSGFSVANLQDDAIVFTAGAMIVVDITDPEGPIHGSTPPQT